MDLVILKHGQMTRATPELASPLNYHLTNEWTFQLSIDLTCIAAPTRRVFCGPGARTRNMPTMIRYLDHLEPRPYSAVPKSPSSS
ncbi:hypothetical protein TNCV_4486801 [Trichonephila clavipes]|nr:hypothetical protein TNCV_4486801 [Trichonephila clavipes]